MGNQIRDQKTVGEYQSGEKEPAVLEGYFYPAQIAWGAVPPLTAIFISGAGIRTLSPMDGWEDALIHQIPASGPPSG